MMKHGKKQKIGLMGGTFNPIHYGHLLIAENAREQFALTQVIFLPTGHSPHKNTDQILDAERRCEMVRLAIAGNRYFSCSDYEAARAGISYTYLTLQHFADCFEESELYFIMGGDALADFGGWMHPEEISRLSTILAAVRDELTVENLLPVRERLRQNYGTRIEFINTPGFSVSSRLIRQRVKEQRSIRYLVPEAVRQYVKQHSIYL